MASITFDTLKLSQKLEKAGFSREQATGAAEALADVMTDQVVTKADLREELMPVNSELAQLKIRLDMLQWMVGGVGFGVLLLVIKSFWS